MTASPGMQMMMLQLQASLLWIERMRLVVAWQNCREGNRSWSRGRGIYSNEQIIFKSMAGIIGLSVSMAKSLGCTR
jgi:hypothetical protein